MQVTRAINFTK